MPSISPNTVCVVGEFLWGKGLAIEDYLLHIRQPGNRSDELSVYLVSRFCQKYIRVITKDSVWFTGKIHQLQTGILCWCIWGGGILIVILNLKVPNLVG